MRPLKDVRRSIRHAKIESKPQADEAVRQSLLAELTAATAGPPVRPPTWPLAVKILAAVVVVILALIVADRGLRESPPPAENGTRSAADLLTVGALNAACRRGGLGAIDQLCEEADRRLGVPPEKISVRTFTREFNGT
ncbi:MAG: hypothetical protein ABFE13_17400 [Phycisphaerales bacterium]